MSTLEEMLNSGKLILIEDKTFKKMLSMMRDDVRKKVCKTSEAMYILNLSYDGFYELLKDPECLIRPSKGKGKYVLSSVNKEAERLNK